MIKVLVEIDGKLVSCVAISNDCSGSERTANYDFSVTDRDGKSRGGRVIGFQRRRGHLELLREVLAQDRVKRGD